MMRGSARMIGSSLSMLDSVLVGVELLVRWDVLRHSKRSVIFANSEGEMRDWRVRQN